MWIRRINNEEPGPVILKLKNGDKVRIHRDHFYPVDLKKNSASPLILITSTKRVQI
jgi:hypothetical protein